MVDTANIDDLHSSLGDALVTDPDRMLAYRRDQSLLTEAGMPLALVRARDTDDVVETMKWAHRHGVPVVTRGAGTAWPGPRTRSTDASCSASRS